jgi:hypothetical protein
MEMRTVEDRQGLTVTTLSSVERHVEGPVVLLSDPRGQARVKFLAPAVVHVQWIGRTSEAIARAATAEIDRIIVHVRPIDLFFEPVGQTTPELGMRAHLDEWSNRWYSAICSQHVLLLAPSKVTSMAVTVSNMLLGGRLQIHSHRASFEAALRAATRSH